MDYLFDRPWDMDMRTRVLWRPGGLNLLGQLVEAPRVVLLTSPSLFRAGIADQVKEALGSRLVSVVNDIQPNPDVDAMDLIATGLRPLRPGAIIAVGGGSVMDAGKAMARMLGLPSGSCLAASLRSGKPLEAATSLELVAVPTTAGTGAEVTPFATMWDFREGLKHSLAGRDLAPRVALIDWTLTRTLPRNEAVNSGLDALSHALESYWSRSLTPLSAALSIRSLQSSLPALTALAGGEFNDACRAEMMGASLLGGLAISQTRTALSHALSYGFTTTYGLSHGLACSFALPQVLQFNAGADDGRFGDLIAGLGFRSVDALVCHLQEILITLGVGQKIADRGIGSGYPSAVLGAGGGARAENNLRTASPEDVAILVGQAFSALGI